MRAILQDSDSQQYGDILNRLRRLENKLSKPTARVFNNANLTCTTSTEKVLTFNSEHYDLDGIHDTGSPSHLTAQAFGAYLIGGHVRFSANSTGHRSLTIRINGTVYIASESRAAAASPAATDISIMTSYVLSEGDYAELVATQSSGGNLDVVFGASYSPEFWIVMQ